MDDLFEHGKDLVVYQDDEIVDVARYYLSHESERERIAETGRREVLEKHTYDHRADEMVRRLAEFR
jgi:spore maturation protein CgeB